MRLVAIISRETAAHWGGVLVGAVVFSGAVAGRRKPGGETIGSRVRTGKLVSVL